MKTSFGLAYYVAHIFIFEIRRQEGIQHKADQFGYTLYDSKLREIVVEQNGVFRTNCLDWCVSLLVASSTG